MRMQQVVLSIVVILAFSASAIVAGADTEFTYQGRLLDAGEPVNGTFDVEFRLWDDPVTGSQVCLSKSISCESLMLALFE